MNTEQNNANNVNNNFDMQNTKFCKFCGEKIHMDAVICTKCGRQVEELKKQSGEQIIINNNNNASSSAASSAVSYGGRYAGYPKNKWVALLLCLFFGYFGAHKFYEGKVGMGLLYLFTGGLFFVGVIIDFIVLLSKPNPYYF